MSVNATRLWFADLWNYSIIPYLLEALRDVRQVTREHADILIDFEIHYEQLYFISK